MSASALLQILAYLEASEPWKDRGVCRKENIDLNAFFPMRGESQAIAKDACSRCEVRTECMNYADRTDSTYGIWGGEIRKRGALAHPGGGRDVGTYDLPAIESADDAAMERMGQAGFIINPVPQSPEVANHGTDVVERLERSGFRVVPEPVASDIRVASA